MAGNSMKPSDMQYTRGGYGNQPVFTADLAVLSVYGDPQVEITSISSPVSFENMYLFDSDGDGAVDSPGLLLSVPKSALYAVFESYDIGDGTATITIALGTVSSSGVWTQTQGYWTIQGLQGTSIQIQISGCNDTPGGFPNAILINSPEIAGTCCFMFSCTTPDGA